MEPLPEESKRLNKRLQTFRKEAHIQQQEMADYCGLSIIYQPWSVALINVMLTF